MNWIAVAFENAYTPFTAEPIMFSENDEKLYAFDVFVVVPLLDVDFVPELYAPPLFESWLEAMIVPFDCTVPVLEPVRLSATVPKEKPPPPVVEPCRGNVRLDPA